MARWVAGLGLLAILCQPAAAETHFVWLGTDSPPANLGPISVTPFDLRAQGALPDYTTLLTIPGSPVPGELTAEYLITS